MIPIDKINQYNRLGLQKRKIILENCGLLIEGHKSLMRCIAISNDNMLIVTGSDDKTIRV